MTLRCIVGRILQELIEPAERDAAAELADALHDALDSAMPTPQSWPTRCTTCRTAGDARQSSEAGR